MRREIGIRLALGAPTAGLMAMFVRQALTLGAVGTGCLTTGLLCNVAVVQRLRCGCQEEFSDQMRCLLPTLN